MNEGSADLSSDMDYAMTIANGSYDWYKTHAIRSRRAWTCH